MRLVLLARELRPHFYYSPMRAMEAVLLHFMLLPPLEFTAQSACEHLGTLLKVLVMLTKLFRAGCGCVFQQRQPHVSAGSA